MNNMDHAVIILPLLVVFAATVYALSKHAASTSAPVAAPVVYAPAVNQVEALVLFPGDPAKQALAIAGKLPVSK